MGNRGRTQSLRYPLYDFDLRATHARTLLPAALASVSFGFVLVRVRVRVQSLRLFLRIYSAGFTIVKINIPLRQRALSPVRLVLEDSPIRSFFAIY